MCIDRICGAPDCLACHGKSARYYGWCDECEFADECEDGTAAGDKACRLREKNDSDWADHRIDQMRGL